MAAGALTNNCHPDSPQEIGTRHRAHPLASAAAWRIPPYGLRMSALIITESLFGNTLAVAEAIAQGIAEVDGPGSVRVIHASDAPIDLPSTVDLVVIGAPTHTLSLPDVSSRAAAILEGGRSSAIGIREWIQIVHLLPGTRVATFDTAINTEPTLGRAAAVVSDFLKGREIDAETGPSFWVTGMEGPLGDGELQRAAAWGGQLAGKNSSSKPLGFVGASRATM